MEMREFVLSDYYRCWGKKDSVGLVFLKAILGLNQSFTFSFWFRLSGKRNTNRILRSFARMIYRHYCRKYDIYMPLDVEVGYGLYMGHCMCMVIAGGTKIGNNCNLSQFLNIGSNEGKNAVIGDNVYIGPHVCLVEDIHIGNNATIGAGAVVTKDVPQNATVIGVPAKVLSYDNPARYIKNRWNSNAQ